MFESLKATIHAGRAVKTVAAAPKVVSKIVPDLSSLKAAAPAVVAASAPAAAVPSLPASEPVSAPVSEEPVITDYIPNPEPEIVAAAKMSNEPVIVPYVPEPAAPAPKRTPLTDPAGKLRAFLLSDGTLVAVTSENTDDPLAKLSAEDKRPVDEEEEARIDLAPRSSGRIIFLWETYEKPEVDPSGARLQKRLANDIARGLASRTRVEFDPERSANAAKINKFKAI
jgi:hypothetical protein